MFSKFLKKKFGKKKSEGGEEKDAAVVEEGEKSEVAQAASEAGAAEEAPAPPTAAPPPAENSSPLLQSVPNGLVPPIGMPQLLPPPAGFMTGLGNASMGAHPLGSPGVFQPLVVPPLDAMSSHTADQMHPPPADHVPHLSRSNSTVGVPPKSIPDSQNLGSTTRSVSPSGKSQGGKKIMKKRPSNPGRKASDPPSANQSMMEASMSMTNENIAHKEDVDEKETHPADVEENKPKEVPPEVVPKTGEASPSTPAHLMLTSTPPPPQQSPASPPTVIPPVAVAPLEVKKVDDQVSDDEAPRFAEVTDVPSQHPRAHSVASSDSDGPIVEEIPSPKKPIEAPSPVLSRPSSPPTPSSPKVVSPFSVPPQVRSATVTPAKPFAHQEPEHVPQEQPMIEPPTINFDSNEKAADRRVARRLVADRFVTIFSQAQYFGEVKGLKRVTIFDDNVEEELSTHFVVAHRPQVSSQLFFDNVQLGPDDITSDCTVTDDGCIETTMEMYSIVDGGRHAYVEKERDAMKLLQPNAPKSYPPITCVYVTERQALMCKEGHAKRLASLVVVWRPTSSPSKEDECPVHRKLKELYDPATRGLACALCSAGEGRKMLVLSEIVSPSLQSEVIKVVESKKSALVTAMRKQVTAQQRMQRARDRSLQVVNEQFDAILAVIEAKRREFVDEVEGKLRAEMDEIESGIDNMIDVTRLLDAARAGLKASNGLAPPQMATIATAIKTKIPTPSEATPQIGRVFINLADISHKIQRIPVEVEGGTPIAGTPSKGQSPRHKHRSESESDIPAPPVARAHRSKVLGASKPTSTGLQACKPGTSLFNFPLHEMDNDKGIEWRLRIDDAGDWLGVGVGVGGMLEEWAKGGIFDLHHLRVVPPSSPRVVVIRITPIANGNMKLTIHKVSGQQIDDGRIPHWHSSRTSFPQVSFAGRQGKVTMLTAPEPIL